MKENKMNTIMTEDVLEQFLGDALIARIESEMRDTPMRQQMTDDLMTFADEGGDDPESLMNYFDDLKTQDLDHRDAKQVDQARGILVSILHP